MNYFQRAVEDRIDNTVDGVCYNIFGDPIKYKVNMDGYIIQTWADYAEEGYLNHVYSEERGHTEWRRSTDGNITYFWEEHTGMENHWSVKGVDGAERDYYSTLVPCMTIANLFRYLMGKKLTRKRNIYYD